MRYSYEEAPEFDGAYTIGEPDVAWRVLGWQTEPDEDTVWTGIEERTGQLVCVMVGDDSHHLFGPDDVEPLDRERYCGECGQIGCRHDGYPREDS